jgi:hypothetical protein
MIRIIVVTVLFISGNGLCAYGQPAQPFEVVISEILADPSPQVGLPNAEFVEVRNRSAHNISLAGFRLNSSTATSGLFPAFTLQPDSFVILTTTGSAALFAPFGRALGIPSLPSLSNDGTTVSLVSKEGRTIHAVAYEAGWARNGVKADGGWSLEMIDVSNPCSGASNWLSSEDPAGGTPGKMNSVAAINPDTGPPRLVRTYSPDSLHITAVFDEGLDSLSASVAGNYLLQQVSVIAALPQAPLFSTVLLTLGSPLQYKKVYELTARQVKDCSGNLIGVFNHARTGLGEEPRTGDIVISEILFDPAPGGFDYVEGYNRSSKLIDAKLVLIAGRNAQNAIVPAGKASETSYLVFPGDYFAVTANRMEVQKRYLACFPERLFETAMPSLPDDEGRVLLVNASGEVVDEMEYSAKMHFALLNDPEGVSLEKLDMKNDDPGNWHSAASTAGYGTPTCANSQSSAGEAGELSIGPDLFSPDNDGRDDVVVISYAQEGSGRMANVIVFDRDGRKVRYLVRNGLMGRTGKWIWNGLDEGGHALAPGIYIIYVEITGMEGRTTKHKKAVVLSAKTY